MITIYYYNINERELLEIPLALCDNYGRGRLVGKPASKWNIVLCHCQCCAERMMDPCHSVLAGLISNHIYYRERSFVCSYHNYTQLTSQSVH